MTEQEWLKNNKLSLDIWNNKYRYNNEAFDEWLDRVSGNNKKIKELIRAKKFLFGGRTLANRGIEGSGSYSNCYSIGYVPDSLDGIMDVATKIALTFKAQGGQGLSLSKIRPRGSLIGGKFKSDGIIPFMNIFNTVTESISQGGSRKGALMMSIDANHPQALDFITIKEDLNKINKANLSVEISNEFMNNPNEEVFNAVCKSSWKSAEPGILFTDRLRNYNLMEFVDEYQIETTNPCGEQPLPKNLSCNLSSINLSEYVINPFTSTAHIDYDSLSKDIYDIVEAMDDVLEENIPRHALVEQREMAAKWRNIGIGVMGLYDALCKMELTYGSEKAVSATRDIMRFIFREAVFASSTLGEERGNFPGYSPNIWESNIIKNAFTEDEIELFKVKNCLRNCSLLSVAPTGSIGTLLNISTGTEPAFALSYTRKTESLNGKDSYYDVDIDIVTQYKNLHSGPLPDYFVTSEEINYIDRINMQAVMQDYVDTAISSTINLKESTTIEDIKELYKYAWKKGLKGVTIYRTGSRTPILSTSKELKRGDIIKAGDSCIGLKRTLITGCGSLHCEAFFDKDTGDLRECYLSKGSTGGCNNFMISLSRMISLSARGGISIDKILDQLKSCGTCPSYAVRAATKKDTSKGSSCPVAVGNALKELHESMLELLNKEVVKEVDNMEKCPQCSEPTLIHTDGCIQCTSCGYSKCN